MADSNALWKVMYSGYGTEKCKEEFYEIIEHCRTKNIKNSIGGYIVFNEKTRVVDQYLEGPKQQILETYGRIKKDPRVSYITFYACGKCERRFTHQDGLTPWRHKDGFKAETKRVPFFKLSTEEFHEKYEEVLKVKDRAVMTKISLEEEKEYLDMAAKKLMEDIEEEKRRLKALAAERSERKAKREAEKKARKEARRLKKLAKKAKEARSGNPKDIDAAEKKKRKKKKKKVTKEQSAKDDASKKVRRKKKKDERRKAVEAAAVENDDLGHAIVA